METPGPLGDVVHRGGVVALGDEDLERGLEQLGAALARAAAAPPRGRCGVASGWSVVSRAAQPTRRALLPRDRCRRPDDGTRCGATPARAGNMDGRGRAVAPVRTPANRPRSTPCPCPPLVEPADELTIDEVRRYSRHLIIPDVGMTGQKRLKNAKVLVIGAGGLGSPALLYLAAAGVGTLGIAEFDEVDESNLQRQIIHGQSDIGKSEGRVGARSRSPRPTRCVNVVVHDERLDNDNVHGGLRGLRPDRRRHRQLRDPLHGQRRGVLPGDPLRVGLDLPLRRPGHRCSRRPSADDAPCYRCLYPEPPPPGMVPELRRGRRARRAVRVASASIQVNEAIKLLTGIGDPLVGQLMIYDALEMEYRKLKVRKDPNCALCGENPTVTELIDYDDVLRRDLRGGRRGRRRLDDLGHHSSSTCSRSATNGERDFVLVDVREPNEYEINQIPGSVLIPKGEFLNGNALEQLPQDKQIVLHCKTGVRSAEALAIVKGAGYADAVHVGGGVVAWVNQIDPSPAVVLSDRSVTCATGVPPGARC